MTLALGAIGAVVGAALGALTLTGVYVVMGIWRHGGPLAAPLAAATIFGAALGFVLAPLAAWTLMRHVPLWRAIAETALGTVLGFAVGWVVGPELGMLGGPRGLPWLLLFPLGGFAVAAVRLRLKHGGDQRALPGPDAPPD